MRIEDFGRWTKNILTQKYTSGWKLTQLTNLSGHVNIGYIEDGVLLFQIVNSDRLESGLIVIHTNNHVKINLSLTSDASHMFSARLKPTKLTVENILKIRGEYE